MSQNTKNSITLAIALLTFAMSLVTSVWVSSATATALKKDVAAATAVNADQETRLRRVEEVVIRVDENLVWLRKEFARE